MNLSARGRAQAKTLAGYLRAKTLDAIYASPMKRVQQTLAPLLENGAPAPTILPGLREVDFGDWTGFNWQEVRKKFGVHPYDWLDEIELGAVPNGETGVQFRARVEPCLFEIIRRHPGGTAAIFCHGGVIRMMLAILLELPLPKTNAFEIEYASVTQVALHPQSERNRIAQLHAVARSCSMNVSFGVPALAGSNRLKAGLQTKSKSLWRVSVVTTREAEDAVSELLGAVLGQPASSYSNLETRVSTVTVYLQQKFMNLGTPASRQRVCPCRRSRHSQEQSARKFLTG